MIPTNSHASNTAPSGPMAKIMSWTGHNSWELVTLIGITIVCLIIVQVFKKPGQMSVIESQAMDMTAIVPPKGAVPVAIAPATVEMIDGSVTYTGTVQAFTDEDIYPRITGRIVFMPVYPGDRVRKGQLLLQLDPPGNSEYAAKREEAASAEDAAMHNAGIAKSEFAQKKYELEAAQEAEEAARKAVDEADANLSYWQPELARQSALLKAQVVSLDEYQKEAAQLRAAQAKVDQSQAKLREATKTKMAAQAEFEAMVHHIGHQYSSAKQAQAVLKNATIYESYSRILAQDDGVVTKRLISPGVVVNPGMLVLKVAQIKQVRIQAEVASEDAGKIRVGDKVFIKGSESSGNQLVASVTSVFPAADPASRTLTVEALVDNVLPAKSAQGPRVDSVAQYRYLPGQYVIMRILTGERQGLTIPTNAVVWREGKAQVWKASGSSSSSTAGPVQYTCVMHSEVTSDKPGKCPKCGMTLVPKENSGKKSAQLIDITIGLSNPDKTEVLSGLKAGDEVIYAGQANLQVGVPVVATQWGKTVPAKLPTAAEVGGNRLDSSNNYTLETMAGSLMIRTSLSPAKGGDNTVVVKVDKHGGNAVSAARITAKTSMSGMNMPGPDLTGTTGADGEARLKSNLMSGLWQLKLSVTAPGEQPTESTLDVEVP